MAHSFPFTVRPLQPTLVRPFHRDGWVFEIKIDGWRIVASKNGRQVRLVSRTGVDHTRASETSPRRSRRSPT